MYIHLAAIFEAGLAATLLHCDCIFQQILVSLTAVCGTSYHTRQKGRDQGTP